MLHDYFPKFFKYYTVEEVKIVFLKTLVLALTALFMSTLQLSLSLLLFDVA